MGFIYKCDPNGVGYILWDIGLVVVEVLGGKLDCLGFSVVLQGDGLGVVEFLAVSGVGLQVVWII